MKSRQARFKRVYLAPVFTIIMAWAPISARAAAAMDGSSCAATKPVETNGASHPMTEHRLLELFPELSGVVDATAFHVGNTWMGLSRSSPAKLDVALALHDDKFEGEASISYGIEGSDDFRATTRQVVVSRDAARAFLCATLQAPLEERAYKPYISHTDDYPDLNVTFQGQRGPLTITSRSQSHKIESRWVHAPWAISYADRTFVVSDTVIDAASDEFLSSIGFD